MRETTEPTLEVIPRRQLKQHYYTIDEVFRRYSISQKNKVSYGYLVQVQKHLKGFVKFLKDNGIRSFYSVRENKLVEYREFLENGPGPRKGQVNKINSVRRQGKI